MVRDEQGTVFIEYTATMVLVSLGAAAAVASLGLPLLRLYVFATGIITLPVP